MEQIICALHPARAIRWKCARCGRVLCEECDAVAFGGKVYCESCGRTIGPGPSTPEPVSSEPPLVIKCMGWGLIGFACLAFVCLLFVGIAALSGVLDTFRWNDGILTGWPAVLLWWGMGLAIVCVEFCFGVELLSLAPWTRWLLLGLAGVNMLVSLTIVGMKLSADLRQLNLFLPFVLGMAALRLVQWCSGSALILWYFNRRAIRALFRRPTS